ncbi:MAG: transglutaminase family protein [Methylacidiphilales bacterium]|nr:transglutaminase family protein [Candidatus Methylacidiphilales bacterium]
MINRLLPIKKSKRRPPRKVTVRVGCHIVYETSLPTPVVFVLKPRSDEKQEVMHEKFCISSHPPAREFKDEHGNIACRTMLQPGQNIIHHDALVMVSALPDDADHKRLALPVEQIPPAVLRYTLPSRYCDSDKLLNFAWEKFGQIPHGIERVQAICDWTHRNIEYRFGSGRADLAASEVITRRYGVCRDFAHVAIALCRAFNVPARYITGHLPDIGHRDPGTPMDFHAYFEVYLGSIWCTFDARYNIPRIGRVKVAQGLDAVEGAFSTIYGEAILTWFEVWAYQVNPDEVSLDDPIDLSKRLDGTEKIRFC